MRLSLLLAAPLLALLLVACSSDDASSEPPPARCTDLTQETCLTQYYFREYQASKESPCAGVAASAQNVAARRELVLFFGMGLTEHLATESVRRGGQHDGGLFQLRPQDRRI